MWRNEINIFMYKAVYTFYTVYKWLYVLGEDQCLPDSAKYVGFCRRRELFESLKKCQLECCPKGMHINF